jgi:hypothetical protein
VTQEDLTNSHTQKMILLQTQDNYKLTQVENNTM